MPCETTREAWEGHDVRVEMPLLADSCLSLLCTGTVPMASFARTALRVAFRRPRASEFLCTMQRMADEADIDGHLTLKRSVAGLS